MRTVASLILELQRLDVKLWIEDEQLRFNAPKGVLTPALLGEMKAQKAGLIELLQQAQEASIRIQTDIPRISRDGQLSLSFAQQRLWFLEQLEGASAAYRSVHALEMNGRLDSVALSKSLSEIFTRHEVFRTLFPDQNGEPTLYITNAAVPVLQTADLSGMTDADQQAKIEQKMCDCRQWPFDLANGPLCHIELLQLAAEKHFLLFAAHHIIFDGWSIGRFVEELMLLYKAYSTGQPSPLSPLAIQYADFAAWQRRELSGENLAAKVDYWQRQLADAPQLIELSTDLPRPVVQTFEGESHQFILNEGLTAQLNRLSQSHNASLFMTLLTGLTLMLMRYSRQDDIVIGTPTANRSHPDLESLIGFFVNTLALRIDLAGDPTFSALLARVKKTALDAYRNQDLPFEKLVETLRLPRNLSYSPLFQVMFVLQNAPVQRLNLPGLEITHVDVGYTPAKFELLVAMFEDGGVLRGTVEYNTHLFDEETIVRMMGHLERLLRAIVADAEQPISNYSLTTPAERETLLTVFSQNGTQSGGDVGGKNGDGRNAVDDTGCVATVPGATPTSGQSVHELILKQVAQCPDAPAVIGSVDTLSYAELNARATRVANYLIEQGIGVESRVGVCLRRTPNLIAAMLGILKAEATYVPLDPAYPAERLRFMLGDAGAQILLTEPSVLAVLPFDLTEVDCHVQSLADLLSSAHGAERFDSAKRQTNFDLPKVDPANLAYILYTSGSTGRPKGVSISHASAVALIHWARGVFESEELAGVLASTSICFDLSVFEIFLPLSVGGSVVLADTILSLGTLPARQQVSLINTVPSAVAELLHQEAIPDSVKTVNLAGEALSNKIVQSLYTQTGVERVYNLYGPSEDTTYSTESLTTAGAEHAPTIGRPISGTQTYILNEEGQPTPIGIAGELCLGGAGLARGYLGQPGLTAEKFVPDPFGAIAGGRLYRTGDLARYRPDGEIDFLGRIDHQVKVRGFRIELGEIEHALDVYPGIERSVVVVKSGGGTDGGDILVAYAAINAATDNANSSTNGDIDSTTSDARSQAAKPTAEQLRTYLAQKLPAHAIPTRYVLLDALPLTPNGKIDRRALPEPSASLDTGKDYAPPTTATEERLANIWEEMLGHSPIGIHDDFFLLGGHSLVATQIVARVQQQLGARLPLQTLFLMPTISALAMEVEKLAAKAEPFDKVTIRPVERAGDLPLSFAQQRLWFLCQASEQNASYNLPVALRVTGPVDLNVLQRAINEIIRRHEPLRTVFGISNGAPIQKVLPHLEIAIDVAELRAATADEQAAQLETMIREEIQKPFELSQAPLLRFQTIQLSSDESAFILVLHHIVADGWSLNLFVQEMVALYYAYVADLPSPLADLPIQYADFAIWQREWLQSEVRDIQLAYWHQQLGSHLAPIALPTDRKRPERFRFQGQNVSFMLSESLQEQLRQLSQQMGTSLFITLMTGFKVLLRYLAQQDDVVVGTDIANRHYQELEGLIGFFVNQLVLRTRLQGELSFMDAMKETNAVATAAYDRQDVPFGQVVEAVNPPRDPSRAPLFQIKMVLQQPTVVPEIEGIQIEPIEIDSQAAKLDLLLNMWSTERGLKGVLTYNTALFRHETATQMMAQYEKLLGLAVDHPNQTLDTLNEQLQHADEIYFAGRKKRLSSSSLKRLRKAKPQPVLHTPTDTHIKQETFPKEEIGQ